jgi:hypothetical protein
MTKDRHEHFSPLSSMAERLSGRRGSVKCEAAAGGGALAPHLTEPRLPDTIAARRQGAGYVTAVVSSSLFAAVRRRIDSPRSSMRWAL